MFEEGAIPSAKVPLPMDPPARASNPSGFFIILMISYNHLSLYWLCVGEWFQHHGKFVQFLVIVFPSQI